MIILIDAYNVLKYIHGSDVSTYQKDFFLDMMRRYVRRKHHTVFIVFDGGPYAHPQQHSQGNLVVIYSGYKYSADDVLEQLMKKQSFFNGLLVTNDRALQLYGKKFSIDSVPVDDFYNLVSYVGERKGSPVLPKNVVHKYSTTDSDPLLDTLLTQDMNVPATDKDVSQDIPLRSHGTASKEQKRLQDKIRRL